MDYTIPYRIEQQGDRKVIVYADKRPYKFDNPTDSFISFLQREGKYWVNPYGEKAPNYPSHLQYTSEHIEGLEQWQTADVRKLREDQMIVVIQKL